MTQFHIALTERPSRSNEGHVGWSHLIPPASGWFVILVGFLVVAGWRTHWIYYSLFSADQLPMKYNPALGFIICGIGMCRLSSRPAHLPLWLGASVAVFAALTFWEYLSDINLGIDQLFFRSYVASADPFPDRMSPLTASCFTLSGIALALTSIRQRVHTQLTSIGLLSCVVGTISCVAMFGQAFGIESASGWGAYTRMAVSTALCFFGLSTGLLIWAWRVARQIHFNFLRWLPVTGSVTLMVMIAFVASVSFSQLRHSIDERAESHNILYTAQYLLNDTYDTTRGMRSFVITGRATSLEINAAAIADAPRKIQQLNLLLYKNPRQQERLKTLSTDFDAVANFSRQLIAVRKTQGLGAAIALDATGEGFDAANRVLADLRAFTEDEQQVLGNHIAASDRNLRNTTRLFIFGSVLAAILLLLANLMATREVNFRRRVEADLQDKNLQLQNAARTKDNFLATMSHELRTPLNGIIGFSEILVSGLAGEINTKQKSCLTDISTSGHHLLQLINNILDLSKIEAGKMELRLETFSLQDSILKVCTSVSPLVQDKNLQLTTNLASALDPVTLDKQKVEQILYNLLSNAIKFTPDGGRIEVALSALDPDRFNLVVKDTGIGIKPENLQRLFIEFEQIDQGISRRYEGTGLGLALTRKIVEQQGGHIEVESQFGLGTTFTVTLLRAPTLA